MPSIHWRRLDVPGRDHAELTSTASGHRLAGAAHFHEDNGLVAITYAVTLSADWITQSAALRVMADSRRRRLNVASSLTHEWTVLGHPMPDVSGCLDLDLGFTPATNLISIRRLDLAIGERADITVAWLDVRANLLTPLAQTYHRVSTYEYAYRSPAHDFAATLVVDDHGFVRQYPLLWEEA
jgi:hypothetical protein